MSKKDPNDIAAIEKAIAQRYGEEAIKNPRADWDEEKEKEYLQQMRELYARTTKNREREEKVDVNGIKVTKKLLNRESLKTCPVCGVFPKSVKDDVCLVKFDCCNNCYIQYVEGREDRWLQGWRPNNGNSI
tara:strand:- start:145 stop:537 length:393 start_codon:yes stop_codon:yes gene_type:complete